MKKSNLGGIKKRKKLEQVATKLIKRSELGDKLKEIGSKNKPIKL